MHANFSHQYRIRLQLILKSLRVRTLILLLFTTAFLQVSARAYAQQITLNEKNASLEKILKEIHEQSGYDIFYDLNLIKHTKPVSVHVKDATLQKTLDQCFAGQPLTYKIGDRVVMIREKAMLPSNSLPSQVQPIDVEGRVTNENGEALPDATIAIKGTGRSTKTDVDGKFVIKQVDENAVIVISYVGYESKELKVQKNLGDIKLIQAAVKLQGINITVNTGYQTLSKERSAGSFAQPNMSVIEDRSGSMNILQRMDGLVAGLTVNNAPGSSQNPFLIRGLSTVGISPNEYDIYSGTNRNPLFVVDGIPMDDVSSVNPRDVADITVLKDATAASIWGARASNGVIVITTKKGSAGEKLKVQYDGFINFQGKPDIGYFPMLSSPQFIQAVKDVYLNYPDNSAFTTNPWESIYPYDAGGTIAPHEMIVYNLQRGLITPAQADASLDSLGAINNTQQIKDLWYRNAVLMNHTISLSGGGERYAFYGSAAYTDTRSDRPGEKNDNYHINLRQDFTPGKRFKFTLISDLNNSIASNKRNINIDNRFYPYQLFRDAKGNNLSVPFVTGLSDPTRADFEERSRINLDYNPLDEFNYGYTKNNSFLSRNILSAKIKLVDGLQFEGTYGFIKSSGRIQSYDDEKSYKVRSEVVQFTVAPTAASTPVYYLPTTGGMYTLNNMSQQNWTVRNQFTYNKSWNDYRHQLSLLAGQEVQEQFTTVNGSTVRGYNELLETYGSVDYKTLSTTGVSGTVMPNRYDKSVLTDDAFTKSEVQTRFTSYYANAGYTYNSRYSLNASIRVDKSNLFGLDKSAQNRPVWSIGGKWIMTEEAFMSNNTWLNDFAVRATYGITGNSPAPGTVASHDILQTETSAFLPGGVGLTIATPANNELTWESTQTTNIGFDFAVLQHRLHGSIDLYQKKTSNLLGMVPVNSFTGFTTMIGNLGDMNNKGIEISLNSSNIRSKDFRWNTMLNMAYNKNTITDINISTPAVAAYERVNEHYVAGYSAFALFAYRYAGLDDKGNPQIKLADGKTTTTPYVAKPEDLKYMGTYQPIWSGGISNIIHYKDFGLSINAVFNLGNVMRRDVNQFYTGRITQSGGFTSGNLTAEFANRWKKPGDEDITNIPAYIANLSYSATQRDVYHYIYADINVISAAFLKIRDITLSYSLPQTLTKKLNTDRISLRAQISNLMLWKANKYGIDPEFQNAPYGVRSMLSNQSTITFGLNIKF